MSQSQDLLATNHNECFYSKNSIRRREKTLKANLKLRTKCLQCLAGSQLFATFQNFVHFSGGFPKTLKLAKVPITPTKKSTSTQPKVNSNQLPKVNLKSKVNPKSQIPKVNPSLKVDPEQPKAKVNQDQESFWVEFGTLGRVWYLGQSTVFGKTSFLGRLSSIQSFVGSEYSRYDMKRYFQIYPFVVKLKEPFKRREADFLYVLFYQLCYAFMYGCRTQE